MGKHLEIDEDVSGYHEQTIQRFHRYLVYFHDRFFFPPFASILRIPPNSSFGGGWHKRYGRRAAGVLFFNCYACYRFCGSPQSGGDSSSSSFGTPYSPTINTRLFRRSAKLSQKLSPSDLLKSICTYLVGSGSADGFLSESRTHGCYCRVLLSYGSWGTMLSLTCCSSLLNRMCVDLTTAATVSPEAGAKPSERFYTWKHHR